VAGLVSVPFLKETYFAVLNKGAFLNGNKIEVSKEDDLKRALLVTGFPYFRNEVVDDLLIPVKKVILNAQGLRRGGSAAVDLCFIAAGRLDGFFEIGLKPWDVAAGELIVREAGGKMSDYKGNPFTINSRTLVATNGKIHNKLIEKVLS
jgi:myo-inositol-1(or 4)-monophosphatase